MKYILSFILFSFTCSSFLINGQPSITINAITESYGGNQYNSFIAKTGSRLMVTIGKLPPGMNVDLIIRNMLEFGGGIIYNYNDTVSASGRISTAKASNGYLGIDISNGLNGNTGIFEIEVRKHNVSLSDSLIVNFSSLLRRYLVIEKQEEYQIPGTQYKFLIHYADNFFINHPLKTSSLVFLNFIKDALKDTWQKEIIDWKLCSGINKVFNNGVTVTDMPLDSDKIYHIYIHCQYQLRFNSNAVCFHQGISIYTPPNDADRRIYVDSRSIDFLNATSNIQAIPSRLSEKELIYMLIAHEFFHGIQWSHISWNDMKLKFSPPDLEMEKRKWLIEGQAKFLETVIMSSTSAKNIAFTKNTNDYSYEYYVKEFLDSTLSQKYKFSSLKEISYNYALFWRHLYEHNFPAGTSEANRMALLRESAKVDTSSNLASINAFMDGALKTGNFTTFANALKDFVERAYFHDTAYHNWDDPNKNNFYTAISKYTEAPETFNGTLFNKQYKINNSYAFRSHKIGFSKAGAVNVKFTSIATGGSMANFYAKVYVADNSKIYESHEITLTNGTGNAEICVDNTAKKLIVLVSRLDANEGQYPDYKITVTPLNLAYTAAVKSTNLPFEVAFTNTSTANMLGYTWDFGDGEKSEEKSPTHVYKNTSTYDVMLNYKGCSAGLGLQKKAYITFLPYIEKVEIRKTNDVTNAFEFKREFKTDKFQFSVGVANNFKNSADLLIKVTTSGKLQNMQLTIADGNGASVFSNNSTIPIPSDNRIWEFLIPATSLKQGIHLVSISSADVANNKLLCDPEFQSIPYKIDEPTLTWTPNSGMTGIDKNYYFYVEPAQPPKSDIQILTENECRSTNYKRKATFINNSNKNFTIDFGDGSTDSLGPYSVKIHYYSKDINTAIIKTLNSVYQEIVTSHLIKF